MASDTPTITDAVDTTWFNGSGFITNQNVPSPDVQSITGISRDDQGSVLLKLKVGHYGVTDHHILNTNELPLHFHISGFAGVNLYYETVIHFYFIRMTSY